MDKLRADRFTSVEVAVGRDLGRSEWEWTVIEEFVHV